MRISFLFYRKNSLVNLIESIRCVVSLYKFVIIQFRYSNIIIYIQHNVNGRDNFYEYNSKFTTAICILVRADLN